MSWIILVDLRENNGHFVNIEDDHGNIKQFETEQQARDCIRDHSLNIFPCYAISVDEDEISYL